MICGLTFYICISSGGWLHSPGTGILGLVYTDICGLGRCPGYSSVIPLVSFSIKSVACSGIHSSFIVAPVIFIVS